MGEDCGCFFNKDTLFIKPPKKHPLASMMVVLALVMISGAYMCLICLKQNGIFITSNLTIKQTVGSCRDHNISQSEVPFAHYPEPTSYTRDECTCTPVRFFAILSMQRSGSGWFETLLNSHANISSNGEIFSVKERRSNISSITSTLDKVYNMDWYSSSSKNECTAAVGFKWMLNQKPMEVLDFLRVPKRTLVSRHVKIHTRPLSDQVENWDAVRETLKGTPYKSFLQVR